MIHMRPSIISMHMKLKCSLKKRKSCSLSVLPQSNFDFCVYYGVQRAALLARFISMTNQ